MTQEEFNQLNPILRGVKDSGKSRNELYLEQGDFFKTRMFIFDTLDERSAGILKLRFGLNDGKYWKLEEISNVYNLTRQRVKQIEEKALEKLKQPYRMKLMLEYTDETFTEKDLSEIFKGLKGLISKDIVTKSQIEALKYIEDIRIDELNIKPYSTNGYKNNSKRIELLIEHGIETCKDLITYLQSDGDIYQLGLNDSAYRVLICAICEIISSDKSKEISQDIFNGYIEHKVSIEKQKQEEYIQKLQIADKEKIKQLKRSCKQHPEKVLVEDIFNEQFCKYLKILGINTLLDIISYYNSNYQIRYGGYLGAEREEMILSKLKTLGVIIVPDLKEKRKMCNETPEKFFIEDMGLSLRTYNCLKRQGINTLDELLEYYSNNDNGFKSIPKLGEKSEQEILDKLEYLWVDLASNKLNV